MRHPSRWVAPQCHGLVIRDKERTTVESDVLLVVAGVVDEFVVRQDADGGWAACQATDKASRHDLDGCVVDRLQTVEFCRVGDALHLVGPRLVHRVTEGRLEQPSVRHRVSSSQEVVEGGFSHGQSPILSTQSNHLVGIGDQVSSAVAHLELTTRRTDQEHPVREVAGCGLTGGRERRPSTTGQEIDSLTGSDLEAVPGVDRGDVVSARRKHFGVAVELDEPGRPASRRCRLQVADGSRHPHSLVVAGGGVQFSWSTDRPRVSSPDHVLRVGTDLQEDGTVSRHVIAGVVTGVIVPVDLDGVNVAGVHQRNRSVPLPPAHLCHEAVQETGVAPVEPEQTSTSGHVHVAVGGFDDLAVERWGGDWCSRHHHPADILDLLSDQGSHLGDGLGNEGGPVAEVRLEASDPAETGGR